MASGWVAASGRLAREVTLPSLAASSSATSATPAPSVTLTAPVVSRNAEIAAGEPTSAGSAGEPADRRPAAVAALASSATVPAAASLSLSVSVTTGESASTIVFAANVSAVVVAALASRPAGRFSVGAALVVGIGTENTRLPEATAMMASPVLLNAAEVHSRSVGKPSRSSGASPAVSIARQPLCGKRSISATCAPLAAAASRTAVNPTL